MKKVQSKLRPTEIGVIKALAVSSDDKIGEIAVQCTGTTYYYSSLKELCEQWKDYEEPKDNWLIEPTNADYIDDGRYTAPDELERYEELGLKFNTEEEAVKAVEKLKAWTRLKDKGFEFRWIDMQTGQIKYSFFLKKGQKVARGDEDDLLLLFGGEE